jgi:hypothetical protein
MHVNCKLLIALQRTESTVVMVYHQAPYHNVNVSDLSQE